VCIRVGPISVTGGLRAGRGVDVEGIPDFERGELPSCARLVCGPDRVNGEISSALEVSNAFLLSRGGSFAQQQRYAMADMCQMPIGGPDGRMHVMAPPRRPPPPTGAADVSKVKKGVASKAPSDAKSETTTKTKAPSKVVPDDDDDIDVRTLPISGVSKVADARAAVVAGVGVPKPG
jgi:hypothetical protein